MYIQTCILQQGGHKVKGKNSLSFLQAFPEPQLYFLEITTTKLSAIWQHLGLFLATLSPRMRRSGYFS